jgi:hypothetical protein
MVWPLELMFVFQSHNEVTTTAQANSDSNYKVDQEKDFTSKKGILSGTGEK